MTASIAIGMKVNIKGLSAALKASKLTAEDLLNIEGAGAKMIVNKQRELVPVKTGATKLSIMSHIIESTDTQIVDEVGPETDYAPYIEYGVPSKPNYPIQPFIRPSVEGGQKALVESVMSIAFRSIIEAKWPK